ncbi:MAG: maleate cis-trans isomerase [Nesterenkonia sp.]|nr:maleate cis-trans isomerase [Nesterenkonia sp.]
MSAAAPRVGILYPGYAAEDDYPRFEESVAPRVRLHLVHTTIGVDEHTPEALTETGSPARLAEGADRLPVGSGVGPDGAEGADGAEDTEDAEGVESVMWACTSGSFVFGPRGAHRQVEALADHTGLPTSSTSLAFVHALDHLGVRRVAVAASYPDRLAAHFRDFLAGFDVDAVGFRTQGIFTAAEVGELSTDALVEMVRAADRPEAEAMLVPDTAMHTLGRLEVLTEALGKPVLTANQVTVWEGIRLAVDSVAGRHAPMVPELGVLDPSR